MTSQKANSGHDDQGSSTTAAQKIAAHIKIALPALKAGSLRLWGEWFGRPYDNIHEVTACDADGDLLRIHFNASELLLVWSPEGHTADDRVFKIQNADRVRWEWFAYGRTKTAENRYFMDFLRQGDQLTASTNVDCYTSDLRPTVQEPAVEIV